MSKRLLLEGTDLDALMVRVRAELGPRAKVVKAERVRSGGVGGFFAKERFELTVDVPDDVPLAASVLASARTAPRPGAAVPAPAGPAAAGAPAAPAAVGIDALLDAADAADQHAGGAAPAAVGTVPGTPAPADVSTEQDSFATVLDSVRQLAAETARADAAAARAQRGAADRRALPEDRRPSGPPVEVLQGEVLTRTVTPAEFVVVRTSGATLVELATLGVPRSVLAKLPPTQERYTLSQVLSFVPRAPELVRDPAAVVVVAGQGEGVIAAASAIARRIGVPDSDMALAGRLDPHTGYGPWVLTGVSARRLRAATVESETPLVVALGVGSDASDWAIAQALVAAFDPDQVWAAVEADRSVLDVRRWMSATSEHRRYDAITASHVGSTTAPAAILDYAAPVGFIDSLPATAPVWAATLSQHLADPVWD